MIEVQKYDLPDSRLIDIEAEGNDWYLWVPDQAYLILGQSNKAEQSLYTDRVLADQIPVYKRPSGGESVILTPKTLVISVRLIAQHLENPQISFKKINNALIAALEDLGVENLHYRGISDICIGEKKILGSSIYRKKNLVFYHAVLNVSEDIGMIGKYLQHPSKEPSYRMGREHHEFVTNLHEQAYTFNHTEISSSIDKQFKVSLL